MIKAVLFDLDNTLLDFMKMKTTAVEMAVDRMIDAGLPGEKKELVEQIFKIYRRTHIESQKALEELIVDKLGFLDFKILSSGIIGYQRGRDLATVTYPKVIPTLKELIRSGLKIGTISDAPAEQCYNRLARLQLLLWLDVVITFDDTGEYKPSTKPFELALKLLNLKPNELLYVGDWPERDIPGAKKLGIYTAFAKWGEHPDAKNTGADFELRSIEDVIKVVENINKNNAQIEFKTPSIKVRLQ